MTRNPHESRADPPAHRHRLSLVLLAVVVVGVAATAATVVLATVREADPIRWQVLTIVFAVPTALAAAYFCLARGREGQR